MGEELQAMKLIDWMRERGIDDEAFAEMIGDCTPHAVKKWKYGERQPPTDRAVQIERVTRGKVTVQDLVLASS